MKATDKQIQKNNSKRTKKQSSIYRLLKANTYRNGRKNYVYDKSIYYYFYYVFRIFDSFIRSEIIQRKAHQSFDDRPVLRDFSWCRISFIRYVAGLCSRCFLALNPCFICCPLYYMISPFYIYTSLTAKTPVIVTRVFRLFICLSNFLYFFFLFLRFLDQ